MFKKLYLIAIISALTIVGCSESPSLKNNSQAEVFSTQEEALEGFSEGIRGGIMLINTKKGEQLLVANSTQQIYSISQLLNEDREYGVVKLSTDVSLEGVAGASWTFTTAENNKYTVEITNEEENNSIQMPRKDFYLSIKSAKGESAVASTEVLN